VARHPLISAHLDALAARLPASAIEELADGLDETFTQQLATHRDPDIAAKAAIDEFGDADMISAAFVRNSPHRLTARALLATGPVLAVAWAATLVTSQAATWPVPTATRILYGTALIATVFTLILAAREKHVYLRTRRAAITGTIGLLILDGLMLTAIAITAPTITWPMTAAIAASVTRVLGSVRMLPSILAN
jgi:hypothetical protein